MLINHLDSTLVDEINEAKRKSTKPSKSYCRNTPNAKMSASWLASCKAQGLVARDTGKTQKIGNKRKKLDGRRLKSQKYGGPVSPTRTG